MIIELTFNNSKLKFYPVKIVLEKNKNYKLNIVILKNSKFISFVRIGIYQYLNMGQVINSSLILAKNF